MFYLTCYFTRYLLGDDDDDDMTLGEMMEEEEEEEEEEGEEEEEEVKGKQDLRAALQAKAQKRAQPANGKGQTVSYCIYSLLLIVYLQRGKFRKRLKLIWKLMMRMVKRKSQSLSSSSPRNR